MRAVYLCLLLSFVSLSFDTIADTATETTPTFGDATVEKVITIDPQLTIFCDIKDLPPLIGKNMPVSINGIDIPAGSTVSKETLSVLTDLLAQSTDKDKSKTITLKNIQRGQTSFCLIADILINNRNLCDILIEKGLAKRTVTLPTVPSAEPAAQSRQTTQPISLTDTTQAPEQPKQTQTGFIASKTGKVFHRMDCYHVKRIDQTKAVKFTSKEQALKTGKRPCKTCNP